MGTERTRSAQQAQDKHEEAIRLAKRVVLESLETDPSDPLVIVSQELLRREGLLSLVPHREPPGAYTP